MFWRRAWSGGGNHGSCEPYFEVFLAHFEHIVRYRRPCISLPTDRQSDSLRLTNTIKLFVLQPTRRSKATRDLYSYLESFSSCSIHGVLMYVSPRDIGSGSAPISFALFPLPTYFGIDEVSVSCLDPPTPDS